MALLTDRIIQPAKTPKRSDSTKKAPKLKLSTPKTPNGASTSKSTAKGGSTAKAAKSKGSSAKKATKKEQEAAEEESSESNAKPEEKPLSVAEQREKRKKNLLYLRHKVRPYHICSLNNNLIADSNYLVASEGIPDEGSATKRRGTSPKGWVVSRLMH